MKTKIIGEDKKKEALRIRKINNMKWIIWKINKFKNFKKNE
jgi:hypothetical protein